MHAPFYDNEDFNEFLRQQVKNQRMYPSDIIWRNIQQTLHGQRPWPGLSVITIFIIAALTAGTLLTKPNNHLPKAQYHPAVSVNAVMSEKQSKASSEILHQHLSAENITRQTIAAVAENLGLNNETTINNSIAFQPLPLDVADLASVPAKSEIPLRSDPVKLKITNEATVPAFAEVTGKNIFHQADAADENRSFIHDAIIPDNVFSFMKAIPKKQNGSFMQSSFSINNSAYLSFYNHKYIKLNFWHSLPSAYSLKAKPKTSKFSLQVYATPSVSYRRLVDNGHSAQSILPVAAQSNNSSDINQAVQNIPALGIEAGFALGYKITDQITFKTGLQFNMRQYNIVAYNQYPTQPASNGSLSNNAADTLNLISNKTNASAGSYQTILNNRYYQISLPLGIDWKAASFNNLSFGVAGFVQPTYTFDRQPFIITSDLKNYINGSSLVRKWNLNTSVEAYVAYKTGNFTWQVGPQFRYQQLPSFLGQYPVREYLLDYGLKIGVTTSIK